MSCRHDLANGTCSRCYPSTGRVDPGPEGDYEDNPEGPGAVTREQYLREGSKHLATNNMTISANGIAIGENACASEGEIAFARAGRQITIRGSSVLLDGKPLSGWDEIASGLREVFGDPGEFLMETSECSLKIDMEGRVVIGGVEVGRDPTMCMRASAFIMRAFGAALRDSTVRCGGPHARAEGERNVKSLLLVREE